MASRALFRAGATGLAAASRGLPRRPPFTVAPGVGRQPLPLERGGTAVGVRPRCAPRDFRGLTGSADDGATPLFPVRSDEEAKADKLEERAMALCLGLVARRERTVHELRERLLRPPSYMPKPWRGARARGRDGADGGRTPPPPRPVERKGYPEDVAERVIGRLQAMGLQDDRRFAFSFAENRWRTRDWGGGRIRQELTRKHGVDAALADEAIDAAFSEPRTPPSAGLGLQVGAPLGGEEEEGDGESEDEDDEGFEDEMARRDRLDAELYRVAEVQWDKPTNTHADVAVRKRRVSSYLIYRGHPFDRCARVVKRLERRDREDARGA